MRFFICDHCKNLVGKIFDGKAPLVCCGEKMREIIPNTSEGAKEKHLPVVLFNGSVLSVQVGSVAHPMTDEHYIAWVYVKTNMGGQRKDLNGSPECEFSFVDGEKPMEVYAYCNLHGLWMTKI